MIRPGPRALAFGLALAATSAPALGAGVAVDRVAVRYFAPETGGASRPRFVSERVLAFETRVEALIEGAAVADEYDDRFTRAALDRHIAEDMLSALEAQAHSDTPDLGARTDEARLALAERIGGTGVLRGVMQKEGLDETELDELLRRRARAATYVDHALIQVLHPTEEQLRELQRAGNNPFAHAAFETARASLERWFVEERLRLAETTFLQSARARVRVVVTTHEPAPAR